MGGFNDPLVGGDGALVYPSIHSPGFSAGPPITGWSIDKNGSVFLSGTFSGTNYVFNASGEFFYSGSPALGNLILSITNAGGTDSQGNTYLKGTTVYKNVGGQIQAIQMADNLINFPIASSPGGTFINSAFISAGLYTSVSGSIGVVAGAAQSVQMAPQVCIAATQQPPVTAALLEVQGTSQLSGIATHGAGTSTSSSAPSPGQSLTINAAAAQLSDTTRDFMLYLTFSGAGNVTVQAGPTSAVARTIYPTAAVVAGAPYPVRMPAGWFIKCTGTGSVAIASQTVVGC